MIEVAIVGAGPAGLAAAIGLSLDGFEVHVFEKSRPPLDTACGEGLMPGAVGALRRLGIEPETLPHRDFYGISYQDGGADEGPILKAQGLFAHGKGIGIRRTALQEALIQRAEDVGVRIHWRSRVEDVEQGMLRVEGEEICCTWILGADGLRSRVRRRLGNAPPRVLGSERFGVRRHYRIAPWSDFVEIYLAPDCEAYVTPIDRDELGVAVLWSRRKAGFEELIREFPALQEHLDGASITSSDRGAGPLRQPVRRVAQGRIALIGDASGYLDALTGEGLALAFRQAEALRKAISRRDLRRYARDHRRLGRRAKIFTESMLFLQQRPRVRRRILQGLAASPKLFQAVLTLKEGKG